MKDKLIEINNKLIILNKDNKKEKEKQLLINKILNTKNCFLNMSIEESYSILRDLGIEENDLEKIYIELINIEKEN